MSKRPFISQHDSPNIIIVPTVNFCKNEPPAKRQKLENGSQIDSENILHHHSTTKEQTQPICEQTLKHTANSVEETQNTIKVSPAKYIVPTQNVMEENQTSPVEDLSKNCASVEDLNTTPKKPIKSWASNYLMSIGESYKKPIKLNLSLSRINERAHKEGDSVKNPRHMVITNISKPETSMDVLVQPKEINGKSKVKPLNTHEPINKWITTTNTKSEDSKTVLKATNNIATTEYENDRYTNNILVNNCIGECCKETNILTSKSTKEVILNNKEASKMYNNPTPSSYEYEEFILHNPIQLDNNICTKIQSPDFNLFSKTAILTNHIYENDSNIAMTNKRKNFKPLPNLIKNSLVHKSTYKLVYKPVGTTNNENDYLDLNLSYKSRLNKNKNDIRVDKLESPKRASNSSSDFETNSIIHKSYSISPKYVSIKSSDSRYNSNKYKSESTNASEEKKYREKTTSDNSTTLTEHSRGIKDKCELYKSRQENTSSMPQPKSSSRPTLRNRRHSEDVPKSSKIYRRISPDNKKVTIKSYKETRKNENEVKYYKNKEKTYKKNTASDILSKTHESKNKQELKIDKSLTVKKSKSNTKLKSVLNTSIISGSPKIIDKSKSQDVRKSKPAPIKSIVKVKESFSSKSSSDSLNFTKNYDLRTKLSGKHVSLNNYFSKLQKCTKKDLKSTPMERDNLIITVENDVEDEDMKSEEKSSDEVTMQIENVPCKKIKLVINVIHKQPVSVTSNKKGECEEIENEKRALNNIDLSFLDDFNVDEIVESLNECQSDSEMKEIAKGFVSIDNDNLSKNSLSSQIYLEDSDKITNALDIHDEETMDLMELTENENNKQLIESQKSCFQEHIEIDRTENLSRNHTRSPEIEIITEKPARKVLQLDSNIIVLEDSDDSDVVSLKDKLNTSHLEENRISNKNEKENKFSLFETIKIDPNPEENMIFTITVEKTNNNTPLIDGIKTKHNTNEHMPVVSTEHKKENYATLIDYIKLEPNADKNMVVTLSGDENEYNTPLIEGIKIEPKAEENMADTISEVKKMDNMSLFDNIKIEPSTEINAIKEENGDNLHTNDLRNLNNSNTNITEKVNIYAEDATVIDAVDKGIKSMPIEGHIEKAQGKNEVVQITDISNEILNINSKVIYTGNEVNMGNSTETRVELNDTSNTTNIAITTSSSNRDHTDLTIIAGNYLSDKATKVVVQNTTKMVKDVSSATSDDEDLSLDRNVDEMYNKTPKNKQFANKALRIKASTTESEPDSSYVISGLIHGEPKAKDLEEEMLPPLTYLKGPDKFLVQHLEERMFNSLHDKYTVTSYIHRGQFSKIFQCKNSCGQVYAAKVVISKKTRFHLGVLKEKMLMSLQKDIPRENFNCVYIFNGFGLKRDWCFITEYYPKNLAQALEEEKQPFHIDVVQQLSRQLVAACTVLRNNHIVHSDIKPSHILLNSSNTSLKLCGFDEAHYIGGVEVLPNIGTVNYRAPELILGYSADFSIDVWSTALVMFEMATNKQLFPGIYNNDILFKQMCTLGNLPYEMIQRSVFKDAHFKGMVFMRKMGFKGQDIVFKKHFRKNCRLTKTIFSTYNIWNRDKTPEQKKRDYNKLSTFRKLLQQMLLLHPNQRMPIEFVYSNPFIFASVSNIEGSLY